NTATNSHFLAVRENIDAAKITPGDRVLFAVSGSGQVVGSALYIFDDLPSRDPRPKPALANGQPTDGLQLFACPRRIGIESVGLLPPGHDGPVDSVAMLRAAGEDCLGRSKRRREDIDLMIHTGTYRSE